mmetsp:Transcript_16990/g.28339  ORF Transcript_16990/g.28339 Transcript_16990/m.28339 type:complete len:317 (-) Transcript_16990:270-1220(-)|eukprot:CAMPEP_0119326352 /NCGR_PEP_ID=MMETSP1333-20130426/68175_1 /TAXON_ID=418940 /ORGANISM="Scyphosphaera apsteinii, Strain RCC1455" /LENGTH=316 /DNA_ID=CAMNT_0007334639 /DNA_START=126 /DNA_END=1076 /DNA_ORIENTATION=-
MPSSKLPTPSFIEKARNKASANEMPVQITYRFNEDVPVGIKPSTGELAEANKNADLCCASLYAPQEDTLLWILKKPMPPSMFQKLCFCQCGDSRTLPDTEVPNKLRGLSIQAKGPTPKDGSAPTSIKGLNAWALLQTLDYSIWTDSKKQLAWGARDPVGTQAIISKGLENTTHYSLCCTHNMSRATHCTYVFYFEDKPVGVGVAKDLAYTQDDLRYATIVPWLNPCCCVPWLPPCCPVPWGDWCLNFTMEEHRDSTDGRWWHRRSKFCGKASTSDGSYELIRVLDQSGQRTEGAPMGVNHFEKYMETGPKYLVMMR